jgi:hypothetical protein
VLLERPEAGPFGELPESVREDIAAAANLALGGSGVWIAYGASGDINVRMPQPRTDRQMRTIIRAELFRLGVPKRNVQVVNVSLLERVRPLAIIDAD